MSYEGDNILVAEARALREALEAKTTHGPDSPEFKEKQRVLETLRAKHRAEARI